MNKKILIALSISAIMLIPTISYAEDNSYDFQNKVGQVVQSNNEDKSSYFDEHKDNEKKDSNDYKTIDNKELQKVKDQKTEEKIISKKEQIQAFKIEMRAKHEIMKKIRQQTITEKNMVKTKTSLLKTILNNIKEGKIILPEDKLTALLAIPDSLKIDVNELKATSDINRNLTEAQGSVDRKDFNNALSSLDKVISRLQARFNALNKLNSDLNSALATSNIATVIEPLATTDTVLIVQPKTLPVVPAKPAAITKSKPAPTKPAAVNPAKPVPVKPAVVTPAVDAITSATPPAK